MRNGLFEPGDLCTWQNVLGREAWVNGKDTSVLEVSQAEILGKTIVVYRTDTDFGTARQVWAQQHHLRLRRTPPGFYGETRIMELFRESEREEER